MRMWQSEASLHKNLKNESMHMIKCGALEVKYVKSVFVQFCTHAISITETVLLCAQVSLTHIYV